MLATILGFTFGQWIAIVILAIMLSVFVVAIIGRILYGPISAESERCRCPVCGVPLPIQVPYVHLCPKRGC